MRLCAHFGTCGGCAFQDLPDQAYGLQKHRMVCEALSRHALDPMTVAPVARVAPGTRRRASLAVAVRNGTAAIGFRAARKHAIADLHECLVLTPALVSLVRSFQRFAPAILREGDDGALQLTQTRNGIDVELSLTRRPDSDALRRLVHWAEAEGVARLGVNGEIAAQFAAPEVLLAGIPVILPGHVFLQPTCEGEEMLQEFVRLAVGRARRVVDLFAGCGTFALALSRRAAVHAVDSDAAALAALAAAARHASGLKPVTTEQRDLFRTPLRTGELAGFDAAVLDPPRAGAPAQARMLAGARVRRVAYVSCNPESFARDAAVLVESGYRLAWTRPVDQFLWSSHIELVALLEAT